MGGAGVGLVPVMTGWHDVIRHNEHKRPSPKTLVAGFVTLGCCEENSADVIWVGLGVHRVLTRYFSFFSGLHRPEGSDRSSFPPHVTRICVKKRKRFLFFYK